MQQNQIKCLINCAEMPYVLPDKSIEIFDFIVDPCPSKKTTDYFRDVFNKIDSYRDKQQNVMIHCYYGQVRSATLATAYLMYKNHIGIQDAFQIIQKERPICSLSYEYLDLLENFESEFLYNKVIERENTQYVPYSIQFQLHDEKNFDQCKGLVQSIQESGLKWDAWTRMVTPFDTVIHEVSVFLNPSLWSIEDLVKKVKQMIDSFCVFVDLVDYWLFVCYNKAIHNYMH